MPEFTHPDAPFDLRRIEPLSHTIFGVAMTLLAYDLPKLTQGADPRHFTSLEAALVARVLVVALSFAVAGLFWLSHLRRIAAAPTGTGAVVAGNLFFLLTIVLMPASLNIFAADTSNPLGLRIYSGHMLVASAANATLWHFAARGLAPHRVTASLYVVGAFALAFLATFFNANAALWMMPLGFAAPLVSRMFRRDANPIDRRDEG